MPSLLAIFGLDASKFATGLEQAVKLAQKKAPDLNKALIGALDKSGLIRAWATPIGAAMDLAGKFVDKLGEKIQELRDRAKDVKLGVSATNLNNQQFQTVANAASGAGVGTEGLPRAMKSLAEAQEKVKSNGPGAEAALKAFSDVGITLSDVQKMSYQDLFFKIAESMHVAELSGQQLTAGAELMGKTFVSLEPAFKRGFNDPLDQMKNLTDEQLKSLNALNRTVSTSKALLENAFQNIATSSLTKNLISAFVPAGAIEPLLKGAIPDSDLADNEKKLQQKVNEIDAKKAQKANAFRLKELADAKAQKENLKEAGGIDEQTANEEKLAKLRAMPPNERLAVLKQETAELEKQAALLVKKLATEKDAADAVPLAKLRREIAQNNLKVAELQARHPEKEKIQLNSNQQIGAYAGAGVADQHLTVARSSEKILQSINKGVYELSRKNGGEMSTKQEWGVDY